MMAEPAGATAKILGQDILKDLAMGSQVVHVASASGLASMLFVFFFLLNQQFLESLAQLFQPLLIEQAGNNQEALFVEGFFLRPGERFIVHADCLEKLVNIGDCAGCRLLRLHNFMRLAASLRPDTPRNTCISPDDRVV